MVQVPRLLPLAPITAMFALGAWAYRRLPDTMATHWNIHGLADGYSDKLFGVWALPFFALVLYALFVYLPKLDPKHKNIAKFAPAWRLFQCNFFVFFLWLYALTIAWNLDTSVDFVRLIGVGMGYMAIAVGLLLARAEQNWFIGIRTPWTLEDKSVWRKTHTLSAKLFYGAGVLSLLGLVWPSAMFWLVIGGFMAAALGSVGYSFMAYARLHRHGDR